MGAGGVEGVRGSDHAMDRAAGGEKPLEENDGTRDGQLGVESGCAGQSGVGRPERGPCGGLVRPDSRRV